MVSNERELERRGAARLQSTLVFCNDEGPNSGQQLQRYLQESELTRTHNFQDAANYLPQNVPADEENDEAYAREFVSEDMF